MSYQAQIAEPADAQSLAELHHMSHVISFAPFASESWVESRDINAYVKRWTDFFRLSADQPSSRAWKVTDAGVTVGMVKVNPADENEAQLNSMHVHPEFHRRGIGSLLMRTATEFMETAGFKTATLGVIQANTPARALYERYGWTVRSVAPVGVEGVPVAVYEVKLPGSIRPGIGR